MTYFEDVDIYTYIIHDISYQSGPLAKCTLYHSAVGINSDRGHAIANVQTQT